MSRKKSQNPDIRAIAEAAQVSTATVSRALNHHPYVSAELREKILAIAKKLDYAPRISTRRNLFGILVNGASGYVFASYLSQMLQAISQPLFQAGYDVQIFSRERFPYILRNTFCGVIVFSESDAEFFFRSQIPCVVINEPSSITWSVCSDHAESLRIAVEYLQKLHHTRIAFLSAGDLKWGSRLRRKSFIDTMRQAGSPEPEAWIGDFSQAKENIPEVLAKLLKKKPTALIVEGESAGLIADHVLKELRVSVPQELSLVAFENSECSRFLSPAHTTVCQDFDELGRCAAESLIEIAFHPDQTEKIPRLQMVHNHLIERASCLQLL